MPTWKKLGGQTDVHLGNTNLTISGATLRTLDFDNSSGVLRVRNSSSNNLLNISFNILEYGNVSDTLLHQFNTFNTSAEGGAGSGLQVSFFPSSALFKKCDTFIIESDENDSTSGPVFTLKRSNQDAAVVDSDVLGKIEWKGRRSNGENELYADIQVVASDVTNTTEDGEMDLRVKSNGTILSALTLKSLAEVSDVKADAIEVYGQTLGGVVRDSQDEEFVVSGVLCRSTSGANYVAGNAEYGIMAFNPSSSGTIKHFVVNFQSHLWSSDFENDDATFELFKDGVSVATLSKNVYGEAANTHFSLDTSCDISYTASNNFEVKWTQDGCSNTCVLIGLSSSLTCRK